MRIQAKKMDPATETYLHLGYKSSTGRRQIDILIEAASEAGMFAAYCFYNAFDPNGATPRLKWNCACQKEHVPHLGLMIAAAEDVKELPRFPRIAVESASAISQPLHCIDCDLSYSTIANSLAERARNFAIRLRSFRWTLNSAPESQVPPIVRRLPQPYRRLLLGTNRDLRKGVAPEDDEEGFESLGGVMFITNDVPADGE
jgi:hypothetical protein